MLDLNDFRYFVEIVDRGGFSAAARALQRPTSTLSHHIRQLERQLGVTLLVRTSRNVAMTQGGEEFYGYATSMLQRADEAEVAMRGRCKEAAGTVRYTVSGGVAQFAMSDMLTSFMRQYPKINLVQHVSNAQVDIVADRYDLAIRSHSDPLPDSQLVQRPLVVDTPWHLFAAREYVAQRGPFRSPQDLGRSAIMLMKCNKCTKDDPVLQLTSESDSTLSVAGGGQLRMLSACMLTLRRAAEAGLGIVALPAYVCRDEVKSGRLERILPGWVAGKSKITALMPHRQGMSAATRTFLEHIAAAFPVAVRHSVERKDMDARVVANLLETTSNRLKVG